jgi:hypothetical protein
MPIAHAHDTSTATALRPSESRTGAVLAYGFQTTVLRRQSSVDLTWCLTMRHLIMPVLVPGTVWTLSAPG